MYISIPELLCFLVAAAALCFFVFRKAKQQLAQEKASSLSFVLGAALESIQIADVRERMLRFEERLGGIRGSIPTGELATYIRAASVLTHIRVVVGRGKPVLLDVAGEYTRYLGLQAAGAGQSLTKELASCVIEACGKARDTLPVDEVAGILLADHRFSSDGKLVCDQETILGAQLIAERAAVDLYCAGLSLKVLG